MKFGLQKCRDCYHFDERMKKDKDGKMKAELTCDRYGFKIPSYDYSTEESCVFFHWNSDAWREYAD